MHLTFAYTRLRGRAGRAQGKTTGLNVYIPPTDIIQSIYTPASITVLQQVYDILRLLYGRVTNCIGMRRLYSYRIVYKSGAE